MILDLMISIIHVKDHTRHRRTHHHQDRQTHHRLRSNHALHPPQSFTHHRLQVIGSEINVKTIYQDYGSISEIHINTVNMIDIGNTLSATTMTPT